MPVTKKKEIPSSKLPGRRFENATEVVEQRPVSQEEEIDQGENYQGIITELFFFFLDGMSTDRFY